VFKFVKNLRILRNF